MDRNSKKQITMIFEQESLEFFMSNTYSHNSIDLLLHLTFPGYPSANLVICGLDQGCFVLKDGSNSAFLTINTSQYNSFNNYHNCLLDSIYFENEPLKKIILNGKTTQLLVKTNTNTFSNPYNLFSFDDYMNLSFKKTKDTNRLIFPFENQSIRNVGQQTIYFRSLYFFNKVFHLSKANDKNFSKIFFMIMFFEILNRSNSLSIIEMVLKLVLKLSLIHVFKAYLKSNLFFSKTLEKKSDSFKKRNFWEKEISSIKTLLIGGIRSGNLSAI
jgi:hypothetical protein